MINNKNLVRYYLQLYFIDGCIVNLFGMRFYFFNIIFTRQFIFFSSFLLSEQDLLKYIIQE